MQDGQTYREPGVAGSFYSRDKMILERELGMFLEAAPVLDLPRPIQGMIVPHSGYLYAGGVAARAYSQIANSDYKTVFIISPSTTESFDFCSIFDGRGYSTPLGEIQVDTALAKKMISLSEQIRLSPSGHSLSEHTQEVQLPFLQWCLGKFLIVPIVMGNQNEETIQLLADAITAVIPREGSLVVASSDLSHRHPLQEAKKIDQNSMDTIAAFDEERLLEEVQDGAAEMTGYGPAVAVMKVVKSIGASQATVLLYRNSGDINGDYKQVDGYLSAVFY